MFFFCGDWRNRSSLSRAYRPLQYRSAHAQPICPWHIYIYTIQSWMVHECVLPLDWSIGLRPLTGLARWSDLKGATWRQIRRDGLFLSASGWPLSQLPFPLSARRRAEPTLSSFSVFNCQNCYPFPDLPYVKLVHSSRPLGCCNLHFPVTYNVDTFHALYGTNIAHVFSPSVYCNSHFCIFLACLLSHFCITPVLTCPWPWLQLVPLTHLTDQQ